MNKTMHFIRSGQKGFTLIEIMISVAISAVLGFGAVAILNQMIGEHGRASKDMDTTQQIENAGFWLTRDAFIAQSIETGEDAGFPLILKWQNWDYDANGQIVTNQIEYSLSGNDLLRTKSVDGVIVNQNTVASNIDVDSAKTNCSYSNNVLTLNLTSTEGSTSKSCVYQIKPRPDYY